MRKVYLFAVAFVFFLFAKEQAFSENRLDRRLYRAEYMLYALDQAPDKAIPKALLKDCTAIAIFPDTVKDGFIMGERYGQGVVLFHDMEKNLWSAPAFFTISNVDWGFQLGWETEDIIILFYGEDFKERLIEGELYIGHGFKFKKGLVGSVDETTESLPADTCYVYSIQKGYPKGAAIRKAIIIPNSAANRTYYNEDMTRKDILVKKKAKIQSSSLKLVDKLNSYSR